jgi:hypothetical protein
VEDSAADAPAGLAVVLAVVAEDLVEEVAPVVAAVVVLAVAEDGREAVVVPAVVVNRVVVARAVVAVETIMTVMLASLANRAGNKIVNSDAKRVFACVQSAEALLKISH